MSDITPITNLADAAERMSPGAGVRVLERGAANPGLYPSAPGITSPLARFLNRFPLLVLSAGAIYAIGSHFQDVTAALGWEKVGDLGWGIAGVGLRTLGFNELAEKSLGAKNEALLGDLHGKGGNDTNFTAGGLNARESAIQAATQQRQTATRPNTQESAALPSETAAAPLNSEQLMRLRGELSQEGLNVTGVTDNQIRSMTLRQDGTPMQYPEAKAKLEVALQDFNLMKLNRDITGQEIQNKIANRKFAIMNHYINPDGSLREGALGNVTGGIFGSAGYGQPNF